MISISVKRLAAIVPFLATMVAQAADPVMPRGTDPLPSWNDGAAKKAVVEFVGKATAKGGPDFVAPAERIATFDNDGTLWAEQPLYFQFLFAIDRVKPSRRSIPNGRTRSRSPRCRRAT